MKSCIRINMSSLASQDLSKEDGLDNDIYRVSGCGKFMPGLSFSDMAGG